jgi:hypothetical protein
MEPPDTAAVRTLVRTYWSSAGWKDKPETPGDQLERAIAAGVMFAAVEETDHDQLVRKVRKLGSAIDVKRAAEAFVWSLTSRRLDARSALGSLIVARHLPDHPFTPRGGERSCAVCGLYPTETIDRNVLNFERFKWGGVRRLDLTYVWHDLERFQRVSTSTPSEADRDLAHRVLSDLAEAPATMTAPRAAVERLRDIPSNKDERQVLLGILGVCSVLPVPGHPGFKDAFVPDEARSLPPQRFVDMEYPACWWRGENGVDLAAAHELGLV